VPLTLVTSPAFADHLTPPGHPERVERFEVMRAVARELERDGTPVVEPQPVTREQLASNHAPAYIEQIAKTAGTAVALDPDTFSSPRTWDVACLAAGAAVQAVDLVLDGESGSRAVALVRPPGHHAEYERAMGFCFFNSIAVAARHARRRGLARVAIVDFDVHHGNGTEHAFEEDASVLFISSHQYPYYPGTGAAGDVGLGAGQGYTVNLPLAAGATDADYLVAYRNLALPVLERFAPELVLVSAGFDAHEDDPLAGMRMTASGFGRLTAEIAGVADRCCQGRLVAVTEGGYDLDGLAASLRASLRVLGGSEPDIDAASESPAPRGEAAVRAVRPYLAPYWKI